MQSSQNSSFQSVQQAVILFAHGSRQERWRKPFDGMVDTFSQQRPDVKVELAFLEFMTPTLIDSLANIAQAGVVDVTIIPVFFGVGNHVATDLADLVHTFTAEHPDIKITIAPAVGQSDIVLNAISMYAQSLIA